MPKYYQIADYYPKLKNPHKYCGSTKVITLRSGWEITIANTLDTNPSVIEWSSEDFYIQYYNPEKKRQARYFPDFYVKFKTKTGIREEIWEIKPHKERLEPIVKNRKTKRYLEQLKTYIINQCKWQAAETFCENLKKQGRNIYFRVIDEFDIFGKKGKNAK